MSDQGDGQVPPLKTAIVRLRSYGKGENDVHWCRKKRRAHMLILMPDKLQVYTSSDAGESDLGLLGSSSMGYSGNVHRSRRQLLKLSSSSKHVAGKNGRSSGGSHDDADVGGENGTIHETSAPSDDDDLNDGQVFRIGVSLNQLVAIEVYDERRMTVFYHPNKPSKKNIVEEQRGMMMRNLWGAVDTLGTAISFKESSSIREPPLSKYPESHHFTVKFGDDGEASAFRVAIEDAQNQLEQAVDWLAKGLPFIEKSSVIMVTAGLRGGDAFYSKAYPELGDFFHLPAQIGRVMASSKSSRKFFNTVVCIYLSTPLGPAEAEISMMELKKSHIEGGAPIMTKAKLREPVDCTIQGGYEWLVNVEFVARKTSKVLPALERNGSSSVSGSSSRDHSPTKQPSSYSMAACSASQRGSTGAEGQALLGVLLIKGSMAVANKFGRNQDEGNDGHQTDSEDSVKTPVIWEMAILEIDIVLEPVEERDSMVPRMTSTTSVHGMLSPKSKALPPPFQFIIKQHPGIVTEDTARRFIVGLESETKAFNALNKMTEFFEERRITPQAVLQNPPAAFESVKRHYDHGYISWSAKKDCLVELECMGTWPSAYKCILSDGFSEEQMLNHLLFTFLFAFNCLDNRSLPNGKTVKIIDLEGLAMSHLNSPGFKFITRAGAALSVLFPQRLHQCFLINAPGWWSMAWRMISPMIPEKVRKQTKLFNKNDIAGAREAILQWVEADALPEKYGGTLKHTLRESMFEIRMREHVAQQKHIGKQDPSCC